MASILPGFNKLVVANIPGAGLIIGLILITVIGAVAAGFLGRWLIGLGESILNRMPVVRTIYGASKQILETVISAQSDAFRDAVLVEYPRRGLWVIGFVTGGTKGEVAERMDGNMVNVFIPTTPNPTSGFLLFCPRDEVIYLDMSVEDAVKLVVSGGIVPAPNRRLGKARRRPPGNRREIDSEIIREISFENAWEEKRARGWGKNLVGQEIAGKIRRQAQPRPRQGT